MENKRVKFLKKINTAIYLTMEYYSKFRPVVEK